MKKTSLAKLFLFYGWIIHGSFAGFVSVDKYMIACGSSQSISFQGQTFVPDSDESSVLFESEGGSFVFGSNSTAPTSIYHSVRIFTKKFSYQFKIRQKGWHWLRLYFHPLPNSGHDLNSSLITVAAQKFLLLDNFTFNSLNTSYLFKEYMINVTSNTLTINFIPSNNLVTFVNGIEVVSVPDDLIPHQVCTISSSSFDNLSERALETIYRLNVGGPLLTPNNDTLGRTWENDAKYLLDNKSAVNVSVDSMAIKYPKSLTPETAPNLVYASAEALDTNFNFNITWVFSVDLRFLYFVRLHFCDIVSNATGQLVFNIYINSEIAFQRFDLSSITHHHLAVPYYRDFVSNSSNDSNMISVSIGPDMSPNSNNAILNGLEIMKISNKDGSLDGESSLDVLLLPLHSKKRKIRTVVGIVVGALATVGFMALLCYCFKSRRLKSKTLAHQRLNGNPVPYSQLGRVFTFQEILNYTNKFDDRLIIGVGGFGKVYRGVMDQGIEVAIKRGNRRSWQGLVEFHTEIEMLTKLRHRHLVSLIGYCNERSEMILVYEYMANGTLKSHLYGSDLPRLCWKQRLEICIGAAKGLHYLHTGAAKSIIHRDVKTANILLDEKLMAKVADFGISKMLPNSDQTHVSTAVKGSIGYLDPEYFRWRQLTLKSDVYSFGVVLMEVLYARPALDERFTTEEVNIVEWERNWKEKGMLDRVVDPFLVGKVNPASLKKYREIADECLAWKGDDRPTMEDVLWNLEFALKLEERSMNQIVRPIDAASDLPLQRESMSKTKKIASESITVKVNSST